MSKFKNRIILLAFLFLSVGSIFFGIPTQAAGTAAIGSATVSTPNAIPGVVDEQTIIINKPQPRITIPGLKFSDIQDIQVTQGVDESGKKMFIIGLPFLGEYLAAVYRYVVAISSVIAVAMIMLEGFKLVTSRGNTEEVSGAKKRLGAIFIGLIIIFSSYLFLNYLNPNLLIFKPVQVNYVPEIDLDNLVSGSPKESPDTYASSGNFGKNDFDNIFKAFSNCNGIHWQIYKAIAMIESGLNPDVGKNNNKAFKGLLGNLPAWCKGNLIQVGWANKCDSPGFFDPVVNTAMSSNLFSPIAKTIAAKCNDYSFNDKMFMFYYSYSHGNGALHAVISKFGCNPNSWPDNTPWPSSVEDSWWPNDISKGLRKTLAGHPIVGNVSYGAPRANILRTVNMVVKQGITQFNVPFDKKLCPYDKSFVGEIKAPVATANVNGSGIKPDTNIKCDPKYDGRKILVIGDSITANSQSYADQLKASCPNLIITKKACGGLSLSYLWNGWNGTSQGIGCTTFDAAKNYDYTQYNDLILLAGVNGIGQSVATTESQLTAFYQKAKSASLRIIAINLNPSKGYAGWKGDTAVNNTDTVNAWISSQKGGLVDVVVDEHKILDANNDLALDSQYDGGDHLHFNTLGHKAVASELSKQAYQ